MNDSEATTLVNDLAESVPVGDPPLRELTSRARAARRRRTSALVAVGICIVALVAGLAWTLGARAGGTAIDPTQPVPTEAPSPVAPAGMKLVGLGRAVVAVPEHWPVATSICSRPEVDHVFSYSDKWATARCGAEFQASPAGISVGIGSLDSDVGLEILNLFGGEAIEDDTDARLKCGSVPAGQQQHCTQTLVVQSENAFIAMTALQPDADDAVRQIRDSLQLLPEGWTTVPLIEYGADDEAAAKILRDAGLKPVLPDVEWPHYVTGTVPEMGSVLRVGSEVELIPGDG